MSRQNHIATEIASPNGAVTPALIVEAPPPKMPRGQSLAPADFHTLIEGQTYIVEFIDGEFSRVAKLVKFVEQPLGWGATFEMASTKERRFVHLHDIHHVSGKHICCTGGF